MLSSHHSHRANIFQLLRRLFSFNSRPDIAIQKMSSSSKPLRVLITGVTGYIGGSVLTQILDSQRPAIKNLKVSALIRGEKRCAVLKDHNVEPILHESLDEVDLLKKISSEHDVVINNASAFHSEAAKAMIEGLALRQKNNGSKVYYIHTSGTSSIGDRSVSGAYLSPHGKSFVLSDKDDVYSYLTSQESTEKYQQRTTDLVVLNTAAQLNVPTYVIMSPTIYGCGTGFYNKNSIQIPGMMRAAIKRGKAEVMGTGENRWDHVHIQDLSVLYEILLDKVLSGEDLPEGKKGVYFSETGNHSWRDIAVGIAKSGAKLGLLPSDEVTEIDVEEADKAWGSGNTQWVELGFGSNSRSKAELAKNLGWEPKYTDEDFDKSFEEEMQIIAAQMKK